MHRLGVISVLLIQSRKDARKGMNILKENIGLDPLQRMEVNCTWCDSKRRG